MPKLVKSFEFVVRRKKNPTNYQLPTTNCKAKGFTMIELLVVITVIGILTTIAISTYASVQGKARDSKRRSDIDEIRKALELYYVNGVQNPYLAPAGTMFDDGSIPKDPKPPSYIYTFFSTSPPYPAGVLPGSGNFANYVVCARLENKGGNARDTQGNPPQVAGDNEYYCRKNAQ